jgi:RHS repeat-associated protein
VDETGLLFLRARYYAPGRGTFLTRDAFAGWAEQPYSLHPYQYGYSNPLRYTDPTGHFVCGTKDKPCPKNPWPFKPIPLGTGCQVLDVIGKFTLNLGCEMIGGVCKIEGNFLVEASSEEYLQAQADSVFALATPIKYPTNRKGWIKAFKEMGIEDTSEALKSRNLKRALNDTRFFNQRRIRITGHALQRMQERGVSEKQVLELYKGYVTRTFYEGTNVDRYTIVNQGFNLGVVVDKTGQIITVLGNKNQIRTAYKYTSSLSVFDLPETLRKILY